MSNYKVNGVVDRAFTKVKKTRMGDKTINYASVDGQEFSTGFDSIFSQGEMINILVEYKFGEYQLVKGKVPSNEPDIKTAGPQGGGAKKPWTGGGGRAASTFPVKPTDGQMSIIRQNSMNRAVEILCEWCAPDGNGNVLFEPADQEEYMKKLIEVALTVTDFNSGQDIMKLAAAQAAQMQVVQ